MNDYELSANLKNIDVTLKSTVGAQMQKESSEAPDFNRKQINRTEFQL
jgi:hypothetical protein